MLAALYDLYDALLATSAPEQKARKATESVAAYEEQFSRIERRLAVPQVIVAGHGAVGLFLTQSPTAE